MGLSLSGAFSSVGNFIGDTIGGITGASQAGEAAEKAGNVQAAAYQKGIEEQRRQFDRMMEVLEPFRTQGVEALGGLQPYVEAGVPALEAQQALAGLRGPEAQRAAIAHIESSPEFQAQVEQGERALLQRAAATGGLRGGNVQEALAQFRPAMLSDLINQQYSRLGGFTQLGSQTGTNIAQLGQSSAAGQATGALKTGEAISGLLGEQGAARAGGILGQGGVVGQTFGDILSIGGAIAGASKAGLF
jgi:hypothetical protein